LNYVCINQKPLYSLFINRPEAGGKRRTQMKTYAEPKTIVCNAPEGRITVATVARIVTGGNPGTGLRRSYRVDASGRAFWRSASGSWVTAPI